MSELEKNVWLDDVKVVYAVTYTSCEGNALFITKEDAIEYVNKYKKELYEEYDKEWMIEEHLDGDAEDYIQTIDVDLKHTRAATDYNGDVVIYYFNPYSGKWEQCEYYSTFFNIQ
jgi:hypothetical protein